MHELDLLVVAPLGSSEHLFSHQSLCSTTVGLDKQSPGLSIMWSLSQVLILVISSSHSFHLPLLIPSSCYFRYQSPGKVIYFFMLLLCHCYS